MSTPGPPGYSGTVFLSYASEDAEAAQALAHAMKSAGIDVWLDSRELRGGEAWDASIRERINDCALFLPIISVHTERRLEGYFRLEWKLAVDRSNLMADDRAFLLPVVVDSTSEIHARVPLKFRHVQWTRLIAGNIPSAFIEHICSLLNPSLSPKEATRSRMVSPEAGKTKIRGWKPLVSLVLACGLAIAVFPLINHSQLFHHAADLSIAPAVVAPQPADRTLIPERSIAVLPFVDMSEKHDQEFFSDGLSEELIDHLAHAPDLKVIARTSSFQFKGKNEDIRSIAQKLGVSSILEGSVRSVGRNIRVTAQLIRARDGLHLWSQSFDRQVTDIFKVQDEVAAKVTYALTATLAAPSAAAMEASPVAYELFLKANFILGRNGKGDIAKALDLYQRAVDVDPNYARAWSMIGAMRFQLINTSADKADTEAKAVDALNRALALDPKSSNAHHWLGRLRMNMHWDWPGARTELQQAIDLDPHGPSGELATSDLLALEAWVSGNVQPLILHERLMLAKDPLSIAQLTFMSLVYSSAGQFVDALETQRRLLELRPETSGIHSDIAYTLVELGRVGEAEKELEQESDRDSKLGTLPILYWAAGKRSESDTALHEIEKADFSAFSIASAYAFRGDADSAVKWLQRAFTSREDSMILLKVDPDIGRIRGDARYKTLLRQMHMSV
jgi:TolB-like protein/tetratricopeptide (TPR) repeat protein